MDQITWNDATDVADAFAAIEVAKRHATAPYLLLKTADGGLFTLGSRYWLAVGTKLIREYPNMQIVIIVDAGEDAGIAMGAIADGHKAVRFTGDAGTFEKLHQCCTTDQLLVR